MNNLVEVKFSFHAALASKIDCSAARKSPKPLRFSISQSIGNSQDWHVSRMPAAQPGISKSTWLEKCAVSALEMRDFSASNSLMSSLFDPPKIPAHRLPYMYQPPSYSCFEVVLHESPIPFMASATLAPALGLGSNRLPVHRGNQMSAVKAFYATKYLASGDELGVGGGAVDLNAKQLSQLNPLGPGEGLIVTLAQGLDPMDFVRHIEFSDDDSANEDEVYDYPWAKNMPETWEYQRTRGQVGRIASVSMGSRSWQIVGLPFGDEIVPLLCSPEDSYYAESRYYSTKSILNFGYHIEGPGPVSWDKCFAIVEVGDWWVFANEADAVGDDSITPRPVDIPKTLFHWLENNDATNLYLLKYSALGWRDSALVARHGEMLDWLDEVLTLSMNLESHEHQDIVKLALASSPNYARLIDMLADPEAKCADRLFAFIEVCIENGSAAGILYTDFLSSFLETQES